MVNSVESIVAKEENAHYEQLLFLPQCFQVSSAVPVLKCVCMWERVKLNGHLQLECWKEHMCCVAWR